MSELYRRLPFTKETKRPTNATSERNMKQRLLRLRGELDRVQDKLSYQRQKESSANIADLIEKRDALQKEIANIEFPFLSETEKKNRFTELEKAMEQLEIIEEKKRGGGNYEINQQCIAARKKVQEKRRDIPAEAWQTYVTQKEKSEQKNNEQLLQETAQEAITSGIAQLTRTLEGIKRVQGRLPAVIVYPETTTRPLSYAVEPLLKKIYEEYQQKMPHRVFVKTFPEHQTDREWKLEKVGDERMTRIQDAVRENQETIEKAKRDVKKHRSRTKEYDYASEQLHQLKHERKKLRDQLIKEGERIDMFKVGADREAMNQHIREIALTSTDGPILVIDDLIGYGRTFRALEGAFKDAGSVDDVYYFTFLSSPNSLEGLPIKKERFSSGTVVGGTSGLVIVFPEEEKQKVRPAFEYDQLVEEAPERWQNLFMYGFPFRFKKEEVTGVLKDQMDPSPYVVRSEKRDPSLMRSVRQQYRRWGEEALETVKPMDIKKKVGIESGERFISSLETAEPYAFSRLTNKEWRREVLERVDQLIAQIKENNIDELVFLDKSARPLSWLLIDRWKHKNNKIKIPKIKYIDLGLREKSRGQLGEETVVEQMSEEADSLYKSISEEKRVKYSDDDDWSTWKKTFFARGDDVDGEFWMSPKHISELWRDVVKRHPELVEQIRTRYGTKLGKTLIVDDLLFSGGTLRAAVAMFTEAYPEADVFGVHFFNQEKKSPETQIPWFKKQHMIGVEEDEDSLTTKRVSGKELQKPDLSKELRNILKEIAKSNQAK